MGKPVAIIFGAVAISCLFLSIVSDSRPTATDNHTIDDVLDHSINLNGYPESTSIHMQDGQIILRQGPTENPANNKKNNKSSYGR